MALLFGVALGCNVYVTSGDQAKIEKAVKLGAKGGVSYKEKDWEKKLQAMLPKERKFLDAIVDGAGGDVVSKGSRLLKVSYCMDLWRAQDTNVALGGWHYLYLRHDDFT